MSICLYGDIGLIAGPCQGQVRTPLASRPGIRVRLPGSGLANCRPLLDSPNTLSTKRSALKLSTKGVSVAPPRTKDPFPHRPPALPAASIVQLMPGAVIGLVDHLRKDTGD